MCFEYQEDNLLNVRIILGVYDSKLLFITPDISLNKIIDRCKVSETARINKSMLNNEDDFKSVVQIILKNANKSNY